MALPRMDPHERKAMILEIGIKQAEKIGYNNVTQTSIGEEIGGVPSLIYAYWSNMPALRSEIIKQGIKRGSLPIIAQALVEKLPAAVRLDAKLKKRALATMA